MKNNTPTMTPDHFSIRGNFMDFYEEGDKCPECEQGELYFRRVEPCRCHISPPCSACTNAPLVCDNCEHKERAE